MAVKFTNNARTTLAADISNSATTATVTSGSVFPVLNAGEYFYCTFDNGTNNEIVKVTARSGNTLTIVRGVDNTTARAFSTDDAAELRATAGLLTDIQENIAAKSANQTVYNATTASSATDYDIGIDPGLESNAMVFLNGVMQHHDTFSFSGSTLTFDTAPSNGLALEVIVDNLINLQSSNLTVDTFTAADVGGNPQVDFVLSDAPAGETNLIVFVDGVFQANDTYTISSTTLSMTDGVTADMTVTVYVMNPVNIGAPSDNTVTSSKLSGNITMPADLTVTGDVAFDSPTFVVDNANSRVGIGTASPSTLLDIVGDVKMSANLTVDTDTLHVDATNNRVGIGTGSPSAPLHVGGEAYFDAGTRHYTYDDQANFWSLYTNTDDTFRFNYNGSGDDEIVINTSGKVGIGTNNPATGLHVVTAGGTTPFRVQGGANSGVNIMEVGFAGGSAGANFIVDDNGNVGIGETNPDASLHITSNTPVISFDESDAGQEFRIGSFGGAFALYDSTDAAYRLIVDGSGKVGIGRTDPTQLLEVHKNAGGDQTVAKFSAHNYSDTGKTYIELGTEYGDGSSRIGSFNDTGNKSVLIFETHSASSGAFDERMRIDSSGNVGISGQLYCNNPNSTLGGFKFFRNHTNGDCFVFDSTTAPYAGDMVFGTTNQERMRIQSDGTLLVGTTDDAHYGGSSNSGFAVTSGGITGISRSSGTVLYVNRQTSDGDIITFRKDGSAVGSIGTINGSLFVASPYSSDSGLRFSGSTIHPCDTSGNPRDNAINFGYASGRLASIYAGNGVIQTSDRNEKQDIAELTDAETRVAVAAKGLLRKFRWIDSVEEKGDEARIHFGIIAQDLQDAFTAEGLDASTYGMWCSDTWTDDDGVEQTRLGVRYSELLAFIIAAI